MLQTDSPSLIAGLATKQDTLTDYTPTVYRNAKQDALTGDQIADIDRIDTLLQRSDFESEALRYHAGHSDANAHYTPVFVNSDPANATKLGSFTATRVSPAIFRPNIFIANFEGTGPIIGNFTITFTGVTDSVIQTANVTHSSNGSVVASDVVLSLTAQEYNITVVLTGDDDINNDILNWIVTGDVFETADDPAWIFPSDSQLLLEETLDLVPLNDPNPISRRSVWTPNPGAVLTWESSLTGTQIAWRGAVDDFRDDVTFSNNEGSDPNIFTLNNIPNDVYVDWTTADAGTEEGWILIVPQTGGVLANYYCQINGNGATSVQTGGAPTGDWTVQATLAVFYDTVVAADGTNTGLSTGTDISTLLLDSLGIVYEIADVRDINADADAFATAEQTYNAF